MAKNNQDPNCLFCKIIEGKIPCDKVFENENILAFKDIKPKADTHYLFVPKKHIESLASVSQNEVDVMMSLFSAIKEVTDNEGITERGYKTTINTGKGGGQVVFHLHVHLLAGF